MIKRSWVQTPAPYTGWMFKKYLKKTLPDLESLEKVSKLKKYKSLTY
jgi:hypothetical protein